MTPEEKATELIDKFSPLVTTWDCYWDRPELPEKVIRDAKKCALIAVDEILNLPVFWDGTPDGEPEGNDEFWKQVKIEIEKL